MKSLTEEIEDAVKSLKVFEKIAKESGYKEGWVRCRLAEEYGEEVANIVWFRHYREDK